MGTDKLIVMANQIGDFFEAYADAEAQQGIAEHLRRFWNSVMLKSIVVHVQEKKGEGLHPNVVAAIQQHFM